MTKIATWTCQCVRVHSDHLLGAYQGHQPESGGPHGSPLCLPAGSSVLGHTPRSKKRHPVRESEKETDVRHGEQDTHSEVPCKIWNLWILSSTFHKRHHYKAASQKSGCRFRFLMSKPEVTEVRGKTPWDDMRKLENHSLICRNMPTFSIYPTCVVWVITLEHFTCFSALRKEQARPVTVNWPKNKC